MPHLAMDHVGMMPTVQHWAPYGIRLVRLLAMLVRGTNMAVDLQYTPVQRHQQEVLQDSESVSIMLGHQLLIGLSVFSLVLHGFLFSSIMHILLLQQMVQSVGIPSHQVERMYQMLVKSTRLMTIQVKSPLLKFSN